MWVRRGARSDESAGPAGESRREKRTQEHHQQRGDDRAQESHSQTDPEHEEIDDEDEGVREPKVTDHGFDSPRNEGQQNDHNQHAQIARGLARLRATSEQAA